MMNRILIVLCALLWATVSGADATITSELPVFNTDTDPEKVLQYYPLGVITLKTAYSHHGEPDKIVLLANGNEGWVYTVSYSRKANLMHSDEISDDKRTNGERGVRHFVLVFADKVVTDVVYKDDGTGIGVTAMELQYSRPNPRSGP